ncbi:MAG: tetratricopeptide repeat protein [Deltaproteobacteria bacterium]|nr:tetratricopeptide repeat protein [Deltaproteobacteria bacterium]
MGEKIATKTLAELYLEQGDTRKALEIYQQVLEQEPSNEEIREAIRVLESRVKRPAQANTVDQGDGTGRSEKIKKLEKWREKIRNIQRRRRQGDVV